MKSQPTYREVIDWLAREAIRAAHNLKLTDDAALDIVLENMQYNVIRKMKRKEGEHDKK